VSALGKVRVGIGPLRGAAISKSEQGECAARTNACVQTAGEIAVGSWALYKTSWRLMMQRERARGVGGVTGRSSTTKSSARGAHMASSAGSRAGVQGAVATFTAAPGSGPGLREVFGCWDCRAKMWRGQQAVLRAFASARQWCVHGVSRILAMTSTSEIRLAGRQRVLAQSICSKSAFTECA
jgi:hypothetical protein